MCEGDGAQIRHNSSTRTHAVPSPCTHLWEEVYLLCGPRLSGSDNILQLREKFTHILPVSWILFKLHCFMCPVGTSLKCNGLGIGLTWNGESWCLMESFSGTLCSKLL